MNVADVEERKKTLTCTSMDWRSVSLLPIELTSFKLCLTHFEVVTSRQEGLIQSRVFSMKEYSCLYKHTIVDNSCQLSAAVELNLHLLG